MSLTTANRLLSGFGRIATPRKRNSDAQAVVQSLYQGMLQRDVDPASLAHFSQYVHRGSLVELIRIVIESDEYKQKRAAEREARNRFISGSDCNIDVRATAEQIAEMLRRIQVSWHFFGKTEPHWSVVSHDVYRTKNIGKNLAVNLETFYRSGVEHVDMALAFLSRNHIVLSNIRRVLDYGCGVGRLSVALAAQFPSVLGVDVSEKHIEIARGYAAERQINNLDFMKVEKFEQLDQVRDVDFILSFIALQHNPPSLIAVMIRKLLSALSPGGCALFQVPTYFHGYRFSADEYLSKPAPEVPQVEMHAIPQADVFAIGRDTGCDLLEVRENDATGSPLMLSHVFLFQRRAH